jgi:hypothetical protein
MAAFSAYNFYKYVAVCDLDNYLILCNHSNRETYACHYKTHPLTR